MARIVEFASSGAPEVLEFKDVTDPQPAAGFRSEGPMVCRLSGGGRLVRTRGPS